jgi:hypothetical protein
MGQNTVIIDAIPKVVRDAQTKKPKEVIYINFKNSDKDFKNMLLKLNPDVESGEKPLLRPRQDSEGVTVTKTKETIGAFLSESSDEVTLYNIIDFIKQNGYSCPEASQVAMTIQAALKERMSGQEINKIQQGAVEFVNNFLSKIGSDEELKQRINSLVGHVSAFDLEELKSYILSDRNRLLVYAQKPNATFVNSLPGWAIFNRGVNPDAKPIVIWYGNNTSDYSKDTNPYVTQANKWKGFIGAPDKFEPTFYYDVSDTFVYDGMEDTFNQYEGLSNVTSNRVGKPGEVIDKNVDISSLNSNEQTEEVVKNALVSYFNSNRSEYPSINTEHSVSDLLRRYLDKFYERKETADDNIQKRKKYTVIAAVLSYYDIAPTEMVSFLANGENFYKDQKIVLNIADGFMSAIKIIEQFKNNNTTMKESINEVKVPSFDEFLNIINLPKEQFQQLPADDSKIQKESVKESFFKTLNSLNEQSKKHYGRETII